MKPVSEATTELILASARKEFLSFGFSEASLRRISADCNVSTHTIYTRFGSKEGLFDALVRETAEGLFAIYSASVGRAYSDHYSAVFTESEAGTNACLRFIYEHPEEMKLILQKSTGSSYEHYLDRFTEVEEQFYRDFVGGTLKPGESVNMFFFHVLSRNSMDCFFEIVDHDLPYKEAEELIDLNTRFTIGGLKAVLGMDGEEGVSGV